MRFSSRFRPLLLFPFLLAFAALVPAADTYRIVHTFPHDPHAFTQGLVYADGQLYESTGLYGQSSLRMVDLTTGQVQQKFREMYGGAPAAAHSAAPAGNQNAQAIQWANANPNDPRAAEIKRRLGVQ